MRTRDALGFGLLILLGVFGGAALTGNLDVPLLSGAMTGDGTGDTGGDNVATGEAAELVLTSELLGTGSVSPSEAVAVMDDGSVRTTTIGDGTSWDAFVTGESITSLMAFNETGTYPIEAISGDQPLNVDSVRVTRTLDQADAVSTSDLNVEFRRDGDSITSIDLVADEVKKGLKFRYNARNQDDYYNGHVVAFQYPSDNNVTLQCPNAESFATQDLPDSVEDNYDVAYKVYDDAAMGSTPAGEPFSDVDSVSCELHADSDNPSGESYTAGWFDLGAYRDGGEVQFGVEDEDGNDVGVTSVKTKTLTVN